MELSPLKQLGDNQVEVTGATGRAPSNHYKVCATYVDGYRLMGSFYIAGLRAADKARTNLNAWVKRTERYFAEHSLEGYRQVSIEIVGAEDTYGPHKKEYDLREVMAKYGVHHSQPKALTFASAELAYLATSAAPGMSAFGVTRTKHQPLMRVHSTLINKNSVPINVQLGSDIIINHCYLTPDESSDHPRVKFTDKQTVLTYAGPQTNWQTVTLEQLAYARSGDKGDNANIGVIARKSEFVGIIHHQLTAKAVAQYFAHTIKGDVTRFEIPGFNAFNFFMTKALGGGGTGSIQIDPQGKTLAQMLLSIPIKIPKELLEQ